jgi:hypothetical protein
LPASRPVKPSPERKTLGAKKCIEQGCSARHAGGEIVRALLDSVAPYRQPDGSYRIANAFRFSLAQRGAGG